jgi:hypothetical protein
MSYMSRLATLIAERSQDNEEEVNFCRAINMLMEQRITFDELTEDAQKIWVDFEMQETMDNEVNRAEVMI